MATNTLALRPLGQRGLLKGFGNMLDKENGSWWRTRKWFVSTAVWLLIVNGILALMLFTDRPPEAAGVPEGVAMMTLLSFFGVAGVSTAIGAVVVTQDTVIDEKRSGTAAWVLCKPLSRSAFILSKLLADSVGFLATAVVFQGVIAFVQFTLAPGMTAPAPVAFSLGMAIIGLHALYYLSLTLMLGTFFSSRPAVVGVPSALLMGQQVIHGLLPATQRLLPGVLVTPIGQGANQTGPLAAVAASGLPISDPTPLVAVSVSIVVFVLIALLRFSREEF